MQNLIQFMVKMKFKLKFFLKVFFSIFKNQKPLVKMDLLNEKKFGKIVVSWEFLLLVLKGTYCVIRLFCY